MPAINWIKKNANVLFFVGGFIFDTFTMVRIDSTLDLLWQLGYLLIITAILVAQVRIAQGHWTPAGRLAKYWEHETEALHFCYGGLLSGYVIFYFKSTSFSRSLIFLSLIAVLMIANEMPQVRKWGTHLRLGLYAFCVVSYLTYLVPVLLGRMGFTIFLLSWSLAAAITFGVMKILARHAESPRSTLVRFCVSPASVLLLVMALYGLKLIPPVPLSLRSMGIYRSVEKVGDRYRLETSRPQWYRFWKTDDRIFRARPGDEIFTFVSVFAPRRFSHNIYICWSEWDAAHKRWMNADRFPLALIGGRDEGFRGYLKKENYSTGRWRVQVETEDGRVLGSRAFRIKTDSSTGTRKMKKVWR